MKTWKLYISIGNFTLHISSFYKWPQMTSEYKHIVLYTMQAYTILQLFVILMRITPLNKEVAGSCWEARKRLMEEIQKLEFILIDKNTFDISVTRLSFTRLNSKYFFNFILRVLIYFVKCKNICRKDYHYITKHWIGFCLKLFS